MQKALENAMRFKTDDNKRHEVSGWLETKHCRNHTIPFVQEDRYLKCEASREEVAHREWSSTHQPRATVSHERDRYIRRIKQMDDMMKCTAPTTHDDYPFSIRRLLQSDKTDYRDYESLHYEHRDRKTYLQSRIPHRSSPPHFNYYEHYSTEANIECRSSNDCDKCVAMFPTYRSVDTSYLPLSRYRPSENESVKVSIVSK